MSDYQGQDPGATQVLPATPPTAPPAPPGAPPGDGDSDKRGGIPWWAVLIVALLVGVIGAGIMWAVLNLGGQSDGLLATLQKENADLKTKVDDLTSEVDSLTLAGDTPTSQQTDTSESENNPPPGGTTPRTEKQFAFVKGGTWEGATPKLTVDYAQFLSGDQAAAAAAAHGDESPPPNDYYIVNDNPKLRTFPVKTGIMVKVYNWGTGDSSAATNIAFGQWFDVMPGGVNPQDEWSRVPYWITIAGGQIVKIEQQYLP